MARTDKTNPDWVKVTRREGNTKPWRVWHLCLGAPRPYGKEHRAGRCEPMVPLPQTRRNGQERGCEIYCAYHDNDKIYGRRPKRSTRKAMGKDGSSRAKLVAQRRAWRLEPEPDTIDGLEGASQRHRQLYDPWWWD